MLKNLSVMAYRDLKKNFPNQCKKLSKQPLWSNLHRWFISRTTLDVKGMHKRLSHFAVKLVCNLKMLAGKVGLKKSLQVSCIYWNWNSILPFSPSYVFFPPVVLMNNMLLDRNWIDVDMWRGSDLTLIWHCCVCSQPFPDCSDFNGPAAYRHCLYWRCCPCVVSVTCGHNGLQHRYESGCWRTIVDKGHHCDGDFVGVVLGSLRFGWWYTATEVKGITVTDFFTGEQLALGKVFVGEAPERASALSLLVPSLVPGWRRMTCLVIDNREVFYEQHFWGWESGALANWP